MRTAILSVVVLVAAGCSKTTPPAQAFQIANRNEQIGGRRALGDVEGAAQNASDLVGGKRASGGPGDFKLTNGIIHAIVQNVGTSRGFGSFGGSLIDLDLVRGGASTATQGAVGNDYFTEMFPAFFLTALEPSEVTVLSDGSDGGAAAIRVSGHAGSFISLVKSFTDLVDPKGSMDFTCDYILEPGKQYLKIVVTVTNTSEDELSWGLKIPFGFVTLLGEGQRLFVPGEAGFDMRFHLEEVYKRPATLEALPGEVSSMWATEGDGVSYAFVPGLNPSGGYLDNKPNFYPTAKKDSLLIPIASSSFLGAYFAKAPQNMPKGSSYSYTAFLAVGSGDVASVQKVVYDLKDVTVRGNGREFVNREPQPYGTVSGVVREAKTLIPLQGVSVVVRDDAGNYVSQATTLKNGTWTAPVPAGKYTAIAVDKTRSVARHEDSVEVTEGGGARIDFTMEQPGDLRAVVRDPKGRALPAKISVVGTYDMPDTAGLPPRKFLYDLPVGERYRVSDLVDDRADDESTRRYLEKSFYATNGTAGGSLRPGKYLVYASRGPEYDLQVQEVDVQAGKTTNVGFVLTQVAPTPGWISADFHVHSVKSVDSDMTFEPRVASFAVEGVDLLTSTDHNHVSDLKPTVESLQLDEWLATDVGLELTTLEMGHFNAFPLALQPGPIQHGSFRWFFRPPGELFAQLRALGADPQNTVIQVNHPRDTILGYFNAFNVSNYTGNTLPAYSTVSLDTSTQPDGSKSPYDPSNFSLDFDAMEVFNGKRFDILFPYRMPNAGNAPEGPEPNIAPCGPGEPTTKECLPKPGEILNRVVTITTPGQPDRFELQPLQGGAQYDWFAMLGKGKRIVATGNSDSHGEKAEAGLPRTYLQVGTSADGTMRGLNHSAVFSALSQGRAVATNGPLIDLTVNGQGLGTTVIASDGEIDVHVIVRAAPWIDVRRVTIRRGTTSGVGQVPEVLEVINLASTDRDVLRVDVERHFSGIPDHSFILVEAAGDESMWPVFTPYEVPSLEITDAVSVIGGAFGFGATFGKYKPQMRQAVLPYGFTNPVYVDRVARQNLKAPKQVLPVSNDRPFVPRVMPDLTKLFHALHSDPE